MSVANQKRILTKKAPADKNNLYCIINIEALEKAVKELSRKELCMWLYFAKNQNNFSFDLSRADCVEWAGICVESYKKARRRLEELGYLTQIQGNLYAFNELPKPKG